MDYGIPHHWMDADIDVIQLLYMPNFRQNNK